MNYALCKYLNFFSARILLNSVKQFTNGVSEFSLFYIPIVVILDDFPLESMNFL